MNQHFDNEEQTISGGDPFDLDQSQPHVVLSSPLAQQPAGWSYEEEHNEHDASITSSGSHAFATMNVPRATAENSFPSLTTATKHSFSHPLGQQNPKRFPWRGILLGVICLILLTGLGIGGLVVFAHPATSQLSSRSTAIGTGSLTAPIPKKQTRSQPSPLPHPIAKTSPLPQGKGMAQSDMPGTQNMVPLALPHGWSNVGLSMGDAMFALRTANSFVDREMSYDFRNIGTRNHHAGTFTAATFILTAGGKQRFANNDVRVANNVLFDKVLLNKTIQAVINEQPQIVNVQGQQGQGDQTFAWVNVSFSLWQSQIDQATGQRVEGIEINQGTNQPRIHHMIVVLHRILPNAQGNNPPMGGTAWLVSDYTLDTAGALPPLPNPA